MTDLTPDSDAVLDDVEELDAIDAEDAAVEVEKAVSGRRGMARKYVRATRRRHAEATPAQLVTVIERHYLGSISAAGAALTVGAVALDIGIGLIPGGSVAAKGGAAAAKSAGKVAGKALLKRAAKIGSEQALAKAVPAGDKQLQFELTALFTWSLAEVHGLDLTDAEARDLVGRLTDGDADRTSLAQVAAGLSAVRSRSKNDSQWAASLLGAMPEGAGRSFLESMAASDEGQAMTGKASQHKNAAGLGAGALAGGVRTFAFGRSVVEAARTAFGEPPSTFPAYLDLPTSQGEEDEEPHGPWAAMENAAKSVGDTAAFRARAVSAGVAGAAESVTRVFRSVDRDGDGVPDEPAALTTVKGAGHAIVDGAGKVRQKLPSRLTARRHKADGAPEADDPS